MALDLDGTVWTPDMYMIGGGSPFRSVKWDELADRHGERVRLLGVAGHVMKDLRHDPRWEHTVCALVSCTDEPDWAKECLNKFKLPDTEDSLVSSVDASHIYKANKQAHFRKLKQEYPHIEYHEMIFFDNERYNIDSVKQLGVHSIYCPDGLTREVWEGALRRYAEAAAASTARGH